MSEGRDALADELSQLSDGSLIAACYDDTQSTIDRLEAALSESERMLEIARDEDRRAENTALSVCKRIAALTAALEESERKREQLERAVAEEWRPVVGHEGDYEVSNLGNVRRLTYRGKDGTSFFYVAPKPMAPNHSGPYPYVGLSKDDKKVRRDIHRLVLEAFVGPCPEGMEAGHLNGNSRDARLANLAWVSKEENEAHKIAHGTKVAGERNNNSKLTDDAVREIRAAMSAGTATRQELADKFGVNATTIDHVAAGKTWRHVR